MAQIQKSCLEGICLCISKVRAHCLLFHKRRLWFCGIPQEKMFTNSAARLTPGNIFRLNFLILETSPRDRPLRPSDVLSPERKIRMPPPAGPYNNVIFPFRAPFRARRTTVCHTCWFWLRARAPGMRNLITAASSSSSSCSAPTRQQSRPKGVGRRRCVCVSRAIAAADRFMPSAGGRVGGREAVGDDGAAKVSCA